MRYLILNILKSNTEYIEAKTVLSSLHYVADWFDVRSKYFVLKILNVGIYFPLDEPNRQDENFLGLGISFKNHLSTSKIDHPKIYSIGSLENKAKYVCESIQQSWEIHEPKSNLILDILKLVNNRRDY